MVPKCLLVGSCEIDLPFVEQVENLEWDHNTLLPYEVIWVIGRERKWKMNIRRSFPLTIIARDEKGRLMDAGWPHPVIVNQCPLFVFIPAKGDLTKEFVKGLVDAYSDLRTP